LDISIDWLVTGEGAMQSSPSQLSVEERLIERVARLSDKQRGELSERVDEMLRLNEMEERLMKLERRLENKDGEEPVGSD
jgi:hypothetical protein